MGAPGEPLLNVAAEQMDMSVQELVEALDEDTSIADVAAEKGVDVQTIADAYLAQLSETLNQAVTDGKLTQERADWMLAQATEQVQAQLTEPFDFGGPCPGGFHGGPGMMRPGGGFRSLPDKTDA